MLPCISSKRIYMKNMNNRNKVLLVLGWRTGAHHEDRTKFYWSWAGGQVLIMRTEQSFTGLRLEDRTKFYWSWAGGQVLIVRTEQSFTGLGPEDRCSSREGLA